MENTQAPSLGASAVAAAPKEMLSVRQDGSTTIVRVNFSSLDVIQTCKRKAYYLLDQKLTSNSEAPATLFGSAIHKGLEHWYLRPITERRPAQAKCDGEIPGGRCTCPRCDAIRAFLLKADPLMALDMADKRHPANGIKILDNYFRKFIEDPFEVLRDDTGQPMVERTLEACLYERAGLRIILFGTIDAILLNVQHNIILITDHKTSSSLGTEFYKRIKPNHQYTSYVWLVQAVLGVKAQGFMVNGLQVAKTKAECARQVTYRDEMDFIEMREAYIWAVEDYLRCKRADVWPQSAPNPCSMYGGCAYHSICETAHQLRPQVIKSLYSPKDQHHGTTQHTEARV